MASPYAAGLGGFMNGVAQGLQIGKVLRGEMDKWDAQKERETAVADARKQYASTLAQREREIAGDNQPQGTTDANGVTVTPVAQRDMTVENLPPAAGQGSAPQAPSQGTTPASAAGTTPATAAPAPAPAAAATVAAQGLPPKQAVTERVIETPGANPQGQRIAAAQNQQLAQASAGSEREAIDKAVSARMRDYYMNKGDLESADKWDQYADSQEGKKYMKQFAGALRSLNVGDNEGFIKNMVPILESSYGSGFKIQKQSPVKDKDGNVTGANFEIRNTRTGEVTQNNIPIDKLASIGMQLGSPEVVHKRWMDATQAKAKAITEAATKKGEIDAKSNAAIREEGYKQGGRERLEGIKAQNQTQRDDRLHEQRLEQKQFESQLPGPLGKELADARAAGATDDQIKKMLVQKIEGGYKRTTDPTERKAIIMTELSKGFKDYAGRPTKTPEEIGDMADRYIKQIYGDSAATKTPSTDKPAASATPPAASGRPVLDTKTGKVVYRE